MTEPYFSIVIPYFAQEGTLQFLKDQLNFYHSDNINISVIVALSGNPTFKKQLMSFVEGLKDQRIQYLNFDEEDISSVYGFHAKTVAAIKTVKTPYMILCGGDDLIIPNSCLEGVGILKKNPCVIAVMGNTLYFFQESKKLSTFKQAAYDEKTPASRIKHMLKNYQPNFYSLRRTHEILQLFEKELVKKSISSNANHTEIANNLDVLIQGKLKTTAESFMIRRCHSIGSHQIWENFNDSISSGSLDKFSKAYYNLIKEKINCPYFIYKFFFFRYKATYMETSLKQVAYNFLYKGLNLKDTARFCFYIFTKNLFHWRRSQAIEVKLEDLHIHPEDREKLKEFLR